MGRTRLRLGPRRVARQDPCIYFNFSLRDQLSILIMSINLRASCAVSDARLRSIASTWCTDAQKPQCSI